MLLHFKVEFRKKSRTFFAVNLHWRREMNNNLNGVRSHYIPKFFLRQFSMNPKASKSKKKVYCLYKDGFICKKKVKDICKRRNYNIEDQETELSVIEGEISQTIRKIVDNKNQSLKLSHQELLMMYKLVALLITGPPKFRQSIVDFESELISEKMKDKFNTNFSIKRDRSMEGRLELTTVYLDKLTEKLSESYLISITTISDDQNLITSDLPLLFINKNGNSGQSNVTVELGGKVEIYTEDIESEVSLTEPLKFEAHIHAGINEITVTSDMILLAISRKHLLVLSKPHMEWDATGVLNITIDFCRTTANDIDFYNDQVLASCHDYVIASNRCVLERCRNRNITPCAN